jgi:hypothetical protein
LFVSIDRNTMNYAYDLKTPVDLLHKLRREYTRFVSGHRNVSDHAFNFAITAWHIVDWVWEIANTPDSGVTLPQVFKNAADFGKWIAEQSEEMTVCRDLCHGAKHFRRRDPSKSVVADTTAQATVILAESIVIGGLESRKKPVKPTPRVDHELLVRRSDTDEWQRADWLFVAVIDFWFEFFEDSGLLPKGAQRQPEMGYLVELGDNQPVGIQITLGRIEK